MTEWLSIEEAAKVAGLSANTFRKLLAEKGVVVQRLQRRKRISRANLEAFIESLNEPFTNPNSQGDKQ